MQFIGIEILALNIMPNPFEGESIPQFTFQLKAESKVSKESKLLLFEIESTISKEDSPIELAKAKVAYVFSILEFDDFVKYNDKLGLFDVDVDLEMLGRNLSISTHRGIIFSELKGTYLSQAILPLVPIQPSVMQSSGENK